MLIQFTYKMCPFHIHEQIRQSSGGYGGGGGGATGARAPLSFDYVFFFSVSYQNTSK